MRPADAPVTEPSLHPDVEAELLKVQEEENTPAGRRAIRLDKALTISLRIFFAALLIGLAWWLASVLHGISEPSSQGHGITRYVVTLFSMLLVWLLIEYAGSLFTDQGTKAERDHARQLMKAKARVARRMESIKSEKSDDTNSVQALVHTVVDLRSSVYVAVSEQKSHENARKQDDERSS